MQCAGGPNGDACVVRCRNATPAGPFGSCAVVTNAQSAGGAAGNGTAAAAAAAPAAAPATGATYVIFQVQYCIQLIFDFSHSTGTEAKQGGGLAGGLKKLFGGRRSLLNRLDTPVEKRALAKPEDFASDDAEAA